jgi:hypothetical protein
MATKTTFRFMKQDDKARREVEKALQDVVKGRILNSIDGPWSLETLENEPGPLKGYLHDIMTVEQYHRKYIEVICSSLSHHIPTRLRNSRDQIQVDSLPEVLCNESGTDWRFAFWAVDTWAQSLGSPLRPKPPVGHGPAHSGGRKRSSIGRRPLLSRRLLLYLFVFIAIVVFLYSMTRMHRSGSEALPNTTSTTLLRPTMTIPPPQPPPTPIIVTATNSPTPSLLASFVTTTPNARPQPTTTPNPTVTPTPIPTSTPTPIPTQTPTPTPIPPPTRVDCSAIRGYLSHIRGSYAILATLKDVCEKKESRRAEGFMRAIDLFESPRDVQGWNAALASLGLSHDDYEEYRSFKTCLTELDGKFNGIFCRGNGNPNEFAQMTSDMCSRGVIDALEKKWKHAKSRIEHCR